MLKLSQIADAALAFANAHALKVELSGLRRQFIVWTDGYEGAFYYDLTGDAEFAGRLTPANRAALDVATGGTIARRQRRGNRRGIILRRMMLRKFGFDSDGK